MTFMALAEIADYLDVPYSTARNWVQREKFPEPVAKLKCGQVWRAKDVHDWAQSSKGWRLLVKQRSRRGMTWE